MNIKKFTKLLPYPLKQSIKYIYSLFPIKIRYGRVFWGTYNFLQESQLWSKEKLEQYQLEQLESLLNHAYKNVPYYKKAFDLRGLKPKDIQNIDDLKKLPILTKDEFRDNSRLLTATNFKMSDLIISHTSGTTGKPLQWYVNELEDQKESAFIFHQWSRVGLKPGELLVQLRGSIINNKRRIDYDPVTNVLRLSPRIDGKEIARYYVEKIKESGARFLHGYPSTIAMFAFLIKECKLRLSFKLKAVLFASENVYPWQRRIAEEVFDCRVFSHYGMAERVVLAGECEKSIKYHCIPQYGIVEIDKQTKEIIGTSFISYVTPFIRYKTTDVASISIFSDCDKCGRNYFPVLNSVEGRVEDFIITPKGNFISPAVITHPFKDLKTIKHTQIIQKTLNGIEVDIVPDYGYDRTQIKNEVEELQRGLQKIIGANVNIRARIVDKIGLSKSGKFKWIISNISENMLRKGLGAGIKKDNP